MRDRDGSVRGEYRDGAPAPAYPMEGGRKLFPI